MATAASTPTHRLQRPPLVELPGLALKVHRPCAAYRRGVRLDGATGGAPRGRFLHVVGLLAHCVMPHADYRAAALCNRQRVAGKHAQHPVAARHRGLHAKA